MKTLNTPTFFSLPTPSYNVGKVNNIHSKTGGSVLLIKSIVSQLDYRYTSTN